MRKIILIVVLIVAKQFVNAQNTFPFPETGNVGIGTLTPQSALDIKGSLYLSGGLSNTSSRPNVGAGILSKGEMNGFGAGYLYDDGFLRLSAGGGTFALTKSFIDLTGYSTNSDMNQNISFGTSGNERMRINYNGNVGIGTTTPEARLDVNGSIQSNGGANQLYGFGRSSASKPIDVRSGSHYPYVFNFHEGLTFSAHSAYGGIRFYNQSYPDAYANAVMVMSITNNNVGIGTTNPTSKLTVAGDINSREVKVTVDAGADFVFEKDYDLPSLDFLDKYIKENKHLPEIASAKEMKENGMSLSEMNIKLLQKIEELTLYAIEQDKKLTREAWLLLEEEKRNGEQNKKIDKLTDNVIKMQKEIESFKNNKKIRQSSVNYQKK